MEYVKALRKLEYYFNNWNKNLVCAFMNLYYARKSNKLGFRLGIEMNQGVFDEGLMTVSYTHLDVYKRQELHYADWPHPSQIQSR